jgi:putative transposase
MKKYKSNLTHARTCVYNANYHIVWSVKYRRQVLEGEVEKYFKNLIKEIADDKGFIIESMEVMPDHVHIFASAHPKISPSYIVKMLKGITGRKIFMNFPEIKSKLYKGTLWNSSFYIETVGSISQEAVEKYIETQKERK